MIKRVICWFLLLVAGCSRPNPSIEEAAVQAIAERGGCVVKVLQVDLFRNGDRYAVCEWPNGSRSQLNTKESFPVAGETWKVRADSRHGVVFDQVCND